MSERNNLIKFGPEWLRNLSREGSAGTSNSTTAGASNSSPSQSASPGPGASNTASNQTAGAEGSTPSNTQTQTTKIQLAKLRYGREEMLALYDRNVEPPAELKQFELLFNSRGKPPLALTTNFEDDMRENMRGGPSTSGASPGERYGTGRGMHPTDSRGRGVNRYLRQQSIGRGASYSKPGMSSPMPGYGERGAEDAGAYGEASNAPRWNNNGGNNTPNRSSGEQSGDWGQSPTKPYRRWQPLANTNWRRTTREEGEEWRSGESTRTRPMQQHEKWDREWSERGGERSERGGREKPQWNTNRRTWSGDTQPSEDNLPEWAVDNMEPTAGTFDSSGAFHGYSNDDSNLPKSQGDNNLFQLTRSHTQGSFTRARTAEENEEWWASEKAKKLSPKRFDASEIKFKTPPSPTTGEPSTSTAAQKPTEEASKQEAPENIDKKNKEQIDKRNKSKKSVCFNPNLVESKTFDSPVRSEVTEEEDKSNDDRGNFKSVMITPNNSLRQRHQNIVSTANEVVQRQIFATQAAGSSNIKGILLNTERDGEPGLHPMTPNDNVVNSPMKFSFGDGSVHDMPLSSQPVTQSMHPSPIASTNVQQTMSNPALLNHGLKTNMPGLTSHSSMGLSLGSVNHSNMNMPSGSPSSMSMPTGNPSSMRMSSSNPIGMATATGNSTIGMATGNSTTGMATGNSSIGMATGISSIGMAAGNPSIAMATGNPSIGMATSNPSIGMNTGNHMGIGTGNPMAMAAGNPSMGMPTGNPMGLPNQPIQIPGIQSTGMPSQGMNIQGHGGLSAGMPQNSALGGFGSNNNPMAGMTAPMVGNNSLFMGQSTSMQSADVHGQQSQVGQSMYLVPGMQQPGAQQGFSSIYDSIIHASTLPPPPPPPSSPPHSFHDKWYYEDPKKMIQGPFHASDMCSWYRAGFFTSSLMVRRECDTHMRPLGSYGAVAPFMEVLMASDYYQRGQDLSRDPMSEPSAMSNMGSMSAAAPTAASEPSLDQQAQYSNVGNNFIRDAAAYAQQQSMVESMWPASVWMQLQQPSETRQPLYYWDGQQRDNYLPVGGLPNDWSSAVGPNSLLPEKITKEMKTEDQILAQLRASQSMNPPQNPYLSKEQPGVHPSPNFGRLDEPAKVPSMGTPDLAELQKLMQRDASGSSLIANELKQEQEIISKAPLSVPIDYVRTDLVADDTVLNANLKLALQNKSAAEVKQQKASKLDTEKLLKNKDTTIGKIKTKKSKDDKKDDSNEIKKEDDIVKIEKPEESTTSKNKKEEKPNKKELEKEKKEWIKEGFTIVKGPEKSNKESKKKVEEVKVVEDADRKRKEEEKAAAEEEKARKQAELKKQQQQQRAMEAVAKKAPWSAQRSASPSRAGLTLAEIQKLEKEKKLEQIKEQQHMMQLLIRQQQQQQARELEMQAGLGWAKKKATMNVPEKSLAEIQAEARKQTQAAAVAAAAAAAQAAFDDAQASLPAVTVPWGSAYNGAGGFWDTERETPIPGLPSKQAEKTPEPVKQAEPTKSKKKAEKAPVAPTTSKKDTSLVHEFESWCNSVLASWSGKIDVPTFVGFLKDIESPYEVKDYVKCYLGETKHSDDFARQFLERRSKLLRAGTVTPADDLCSPAAAINPRPPAATEYQENKLKKSKKNKMLKVDARILGFSVTAAEDRINVGDIDSV